MTALLVAAGALFGCRSDPESDWRDRELPGGIWVAEPEGLRIHPSTRFVEEEGERFLDVRVEVVDVFGDSIKHAMRYRFELWAGGLGGTAQTRVEDWEAEAMTAIQQRSAYDPVTRSYVWRLSIDPPLTELLRPRLLALAQTPDGKRLQAEANLRRFEP